MLIVIANEFDPHADAVLLALKNKGFTDVFRIDLEAAAVRHDISVNPNGGTALFRQDNKTQRSCHSDQIDTIWWRRGFNYLQQRELDFPEKANLDEVECYWAFRWFLESLPESKFPFGHPSRMHAAANKFTQLHVAQKCGFATPRTLFTNARDELISFSSDLGDVVIKPLRTSLAYEKEIANRTNIIARPIAHDRLKDVLKASGSRSVAYCQERIKKTADIRVNVLPRAANACLIESGSLAQHEVDWRPQTNEIAQRQIDLPPDLEKRCRSFLKEMGLVWGAFDFGLLPSGEWVFFECNPNGQWLWIEFKTGAPLSDMFASELLRHHELSASRSSSEHQSASPAE